MEAEWAAEKTLPVAAAIIPAGLIMIKYLQIRQTRKSDNLFKLRRAPVRHRSMRSVLVQILPVIRSGPCPTSG